MSAFSNIKEMYMNSTGNTLSAGIVPAESGFLEREKKVSKVSLPSYHTFIKKVVSEQSDWLCWC